MKQFNVTGMSCAACSARVEKAVGKVPGVENCSVSLLTNSMGVEGSAPDDEIINAVINAGYGASLKDSDKTVQKNASDESKLADRETGPLVKRLISSLVFLIALMYISMGHSMWGWPLPKVLADSHILMALSQMILAAIVMVINQKFFISGFKGIIHGSPNMDTLVALGSMASFAWSVYSTFVMVIAQESGNHELVMECMMDLYYESAAMILVLITVGKMLEARSKGKTTDALKSLMTIAPKTANVLRDGVETTIAVSEIHAGDVFLVRSGESIPADGRVIEGTGSVDESALTGESIPVDKETDSHVSAGTINRAGFMKCVAEKTGEDTTLSQIIKMVSDAAATKAPIAKIADKVSGVFVPVVIAISLITFTVWMIMGAEISFSLARAISVLVISCPCALGLATPVAIMVGNGVGARNGVLFKTAVSLEQTGKVKTVVLDKTGTITSGKPAVNKIITLNGFSEKELITTAYSLETMSEHPLAGAICEMASQKYSVEEVSDFKVYPGNGLSGTVSGRRIKIGNYRFISERCSVTENDKKEIEKLALQGATPVIIAIDDTVAGIISISDALKTDSRDAIESLKQMGIKVVMLTGDNETTAKAVGSEAGVDDVIAGVLPDGKEAVVRDLKKNGNVIMVGDGINDAPALTTADIGIAIGAGTDVAIDAADVVVMKSSLSDVVSAIRLSRATLTNIKENLFWAFIYNIIGIPLAAGVFINIFGWKLNPMFGALAMSLSSFCVVTNALRLNFTKAFKKSDIINQEETMMISSEEGDKNMTKTLKIEGMMCGHCEARVKKVLEALPEVTEAIVSHTEGTAVVTLTSEVDDAVLKKTVEDQDYTVTGIE